MIETPVLPGSFLARVSEQLGEEASLLFKALEGEPQISVRLNPLKPGAKFDDTVPVPWCEGAFFLAARPKFIRDPFIHSGAYYVQEASSMLLRQLIPFDRDITVLDLCAAPGGKSTLISSFLSENSILVSNEIVGKRAEILEENVTRWGSHNTIVTSNRPADFGKLQNSFDVIVVDAPCSGEGMFRKDPAVRETWSPGVVMQCASRQKEILQEVMPALKPGGRLIYSTCTFNRDENENVIEWLQGSISDEFEILHFDFPDEWGIAGGKYFRRCFPHRFRGEGFAFCALEKKGNWKQLKKLNEGLKETLSQTKKEQFREIAGKFLEADRDWQFVENENRIFALPKAQFQRMIPFRGKLRHRTLGVPIGTLHFNKFIPDHGLAMYSGLRTEIPRIELSYEDAIRYLKRESLPSAGKSGTGWVLPSFRGHVLGWAKCVNNHLNNHFPAHWKIRADISSWDFSEAE